MAEELGLDVTVDEKVAAKLAHQRQARAGEGHVQFDFECRGGEHERADFRRVVVDPGGCDHRADALGDDRNIFGLDTVSGADVVAESLHVAGAGGEARAVAALAGRLAVTTGIPGEEVEMRQVQFIDQVGDAPRMLMAAMEQKDRLARLAVRWGGSRPVPVEKLDAIMGTEGVFLLFAHRKILMQKGKCVVLL